MLGIPRRDGNAGHEKEQEERGRQGELRPAWSEAAGMTVGINGVAMGVVYLFKNGSRVACYSALDTTVSGVCTVIFTSLEPLNIASLISWKESHHHHMEENGYIRLLDRSLRKPVRRSFQLILLPCIYDQISVLFFVS